jgi:hypothetical protein
VLSARKDAKMAHFTDVYGGRSPTCPVCGKSVMNVPGHAEYMVMLKSFLDPLWADHLALFVMES